jgi:heat shock protein beta
MCIKLKYLSFNIFIDVLP